VISPATWLPHRRNPSELGLHSRSLEASRAQGQGAMGQAHRRWLRRRRGPSRPARRQDPGALRRGQERSRKAALRVAAQGHRCVVHQGRRPPL